MERYRHHRQEISEAFWPWLTKAFGMPALLATPARTKNPLPPSRLDKMARERLALLLGASGLQEDDAERAYFSSGGDLPDLLRHRLGDIVSAPDGVLYPRNATDVQGILAICAELDIAVFPSGMGPAVLHGDGRPVLALDMSGLGHILTRDSMSGLVEVEAGISGRELERQLDAQGMTLGEEFENSIGGWIASSDPMPAAVRSLKVATPRGPLNLDNGLHHLLAGSRGRLGVITSAQLRIRHRPQDEDCRAYLFRDFAAGLAILREIAHMNIPHDRLLLLDDGATRFEEALSRDLWNLGERLHNAWRLMRGFDDRAARLVISFSGGAMQRNQARKDFEALAKRLGMLPLGPAPLPVPHPRDALLDRGVGIDHVQFSASWSDLPRHYARLRARLNQAMRDHPALPGAHGLVLAKVSTVRSDGALLTVTWLFPRKLQDQVVQATAIRDAVLAAGRKGYPGLARKVLDAIRLAVDPKNILPPGP